VTWKPHIEVVGVDDDLEMVIIASDGNLSGIHCEMIFHVL